MSCRFIDRSDSTSFLAFELIQIYKMRLEPVSVEGLGPVAQCGPR